MNCPCQQRDCILCEGMVRTESGLIQVCEVPRLVVRETVPPGKPLFLQGDHADWFYILRDGYIKLSTTLADGRQHVVCVSRGGQTLGFDALSSGRYGHTAQALTYITVCSVRIAEAWQIFENNPEVSRRTIVALGLELEHSRAQLCDLGMKSALERVASYLLRLGCTPLGIPTTVAQPLKRAEIAEMLGLTIGTVSRNITKLQRERIIRAPRGWLRVLDPTRLRAIAGEPPRSG